MAMRRRNLYGLASLSIFPGNIDLIPTAVGIKAVLGCLPKGVVARSLPAGYRGSPERCPVVLSGDGLRADGGRRSISMGRHRRSIPTHACLHRWPTL